MVRLSPWLTGLRMEGTFPTIENYTISPADICAVYVPNPFAIISRKSEYVYYQKENGGKKDAEQEI